MATETVLAEVRLAGRLDVLDPQDRLRCRRSYAGLHRTRISWRWMRRKASRRAPLPARTASRRWPAPPAPARRRCCAMRSRRTGGGCSSLLPREGPCGWRLARSGPRHPVFMPCFLTTATDGALTRPARRCGSRVEWETAIVLVDLTIEQGVGLTFVGDTHQALPVGHARAMGLRSGTRARRSSSTRCAGSAIPTTRRSHGGSGMRVIASVRWWLRAGLPNTSTSTGSTITTRRVSG
ncbi:hypothetical protein QE411_000674 [Microbacterium arborescens]|nr:hypothetical protein [Microbacterium arborescens]